MSKDEIAKGERGGCGSPEQVVRIGKRAYRVRTQVVVEEVDCDDAELNADVQRAAGGGFQMMLSEQDASSIDKSEQAILGTCWPAMRNALSEHLHAVSKKKPKRSGA
jgi:hypothetical protein